MIPKVEAAAVNRFQALVAGDARFVLKKVFGQPAAFVNGNMCLGAFGSDVFLRLSEPDQKLAKKLPGTHPFEPMPGRAMKGYLVLPPNVLDDPKQAATWVERSVKWTAGLPPKAKKSPR